MKKQKPVHVGIIPDGNRRWAVAHGLSKADGYHYGLEPGLRLLQQAKVYGIQELTYYGFTVDNCKLQASTSLQHFKKHAWKRYNS